MRVCYITGKICNSCNFCGRYEYTILKDGLVWEDRIDGEDNCIEKFNQFAKDFPESEFKYRCMTEDEMFVYELKGEA